MKKLFMTILLIIFAVSSFAGEKYGGFLSEKLNTRAVAMGGAYITISDDGGFVYNPAGLAYSDELYLGYTTYSEYNTFNNYEVILPLVKGGGLALAASYATLEITDIEERDFKGNVIGKFNEFEEAVSVGMGLQFEENLGIGFTIKDISQEIEGFVSGNGITADFGVIYLLSDFIYLGGILTNMKGAEIVWDEQTNLKDDIPSTLKLGSSLRLFDDGFITSVEYENELGEKERTATKIGQEIWIKDILALRIGRKSETVISEQNEIEAETNQEIMNYGLGLRFRGFIFDYAYSQEDLGNVSRYTFGLNF